MNIEDTIDAIWARPDLSEDDYKNVLNLLQQSLADPHMPAADRLRITQNILANNAKTEIADRAGALIVRLISGPALTEFIPAEDKLSALGDIVAYCARESAVRQGAINKIADLLEDPGLHPKNCVPVLQFALREKGVKVANRDVEAWVRSLIVFRDTTPIETLGAVSPRIARAFSERRFSEIGGYVVLRDALVSSRNNRLPGSPEY